MVIFVFVVCVCAAFVAGFSFGRLKAYKKGYSEGYKSGNDGGLSEDEKDSIRQVLAVLTFGAEKKNED